MSENRRRSETLTIRLTKSEKAAITAQARKASMSLTEYIVALSCETEIIVPPDVMPLLVELKRIGNNLNQIAAKVNSGVTYVPDLKDVLAGQQHIVQQLKEWTEVTPWQR
jgi:hypothetical protein